MSWVALALLSALFLGLYDLGTKHAVRDNAVLPVLFFANLSSATVWLVLMAWDQHGGGMPALFHVAPLTPFQHLQLAFKSLLVGSSWICSYFAVKHLPVSLASPIRATGPLWTLGGALLVLAERPSWLEMVGVAVTLASFVGLSLAGAKEGIHFHRNKWIWLLVGGTLLGATSGLYDKFLLHRQGFTAATVQAWFAIYLAVLFFPLALGWKLRLWQRNVFQWRWSILVVSFGLLIADFLYFHALRDSEALVSLVSSIRRGSTLVAFAGGLWLFQEKNGWQKLPAVLGVLTGIALTLLG
jgi:drug/metabolite transporter (DMT)-like permease